MTQEENPLGGQLGGIEGALGSTANLGSGSTNEALGALTGLLGGLGK